MTRKLAQKTLRPEMEILYNGLPSIVKSINSMFVVLCVLPTPVMVLGIANLKLTTNYVSRLLNDNSITLLTN